MIAGMSIEIYNAMIIDRPCSRDREETEIWGRFP
jgi:hypothetical protein